MEIYTFNKDSGKRITKYNSDFIMSRIIQTKEKVHIGCMHLDKNGVIGFHEAVVSQMLLITRGEGYVRGEKEEYIKVLPGDAVFWDKGEWHETKTDTGLTAIVIESEGLCPMDFMGLKNTNK